jgi:hypothetical protein
MLRGMGSKENDLHVTLNPLRHMRPLWRGVFVLPEAPERTTLKHQNFLYKQTLFLLKIYVV